MSGCLALIGGAVSLTPLANSALGALWFQAAATVIADGRTLPVVFPRLHIHIDASSDVVDLANTEPDDAFVELVDKMVASDNSFGATLLVPRLVTSPADLRQPRIADVRDPSRMGSPRMLEVPIAVLEAVLSGQRDRGRNSVVSVEPFRCVADTVAYDILGQRPRREDTGTLSRTGMDRSSRFELAEARRLRNHRRDTQGRLASAGVIPWVCWPGRELPHGWLERGEVQRAIGDWRRQASGVLLCDQIVRAAIDEGCRAA